MNSQLKYKCGSFIEIMKLLSILVIKLIETIKVSHNKMQYYRFTEKVFYTIVDKPKKSKFKTIARSIFFIEILKKRSKKSRALKESSEL